MFIETKTTKKDPFLFNDIQLVADQSFPKLCHSKLSTSQTNYKPNQKRLQWFTFEYAMIFITIDINVKYPSNMFKESITQQVRQEDGTSVIVLIFKLLFGKTIFQFHFSFSFSPLKNVWSSKQKYRANLLNYIALFTIHLCFTTYLVNMYLFFVFCLLVHRFTIRTPLPFVL